MGHSRGRHQIGSLVGNDWRQRGRAEGEVGVWAPGRSIGRRLISTDTSGNKGVRRRIRLFVSSVGVRVVTKRRLGWNSLCGETCARRAVSRRCL